MKNKNKTLKALKKQITTLPQRLVKQSTNFIEDAVRDGAPAALPPGRGGVQCFFKVRFGLKNNN